MVVAVTASWLGTNGKARAAGLDGFIGQAARSRQVSRSNGHLLRGEEV